MVRIKALEAPWFPIRAPHRQLDIDGPNLIDYVPSQQTAALFCSERPEYGCATGPCLLDVPDGQVVGHRLKSEYRVDIAYLHPRLGLGYNRGIVQDGPDAAFCQAVNHFLSVLPGDR